MGSDELFYRTLMCAVVENAIIEATAKIKVSIHQQARAMEYLMGEQFQHDMDLLGMENTVNTVRRMVEEAVSERKVTQLILFSNGQKQCSCCGATKSMSEFGTHPQARDGKKSRCNQCVNEQRRLRYISRKQQKVYA